jgi:hypothetical protein
LHAASHRGIEYVEILVIATLEPNSERPIICIALNAVRLSWQPHACLAA